MSTARDSVAETVRAVDYDRFLSALFAPEPQRRHLLALYAFNYEVAKTAEMVSQPLIGQIRLQWWRETIADIYAGKVRQHETAIALAAAIDACALPQDLFDTLIDARERDIFPEGFSDLADLESYADATSGGLMRLAARILGAGVALDAAAKDAGITYALAGIVRAIPFHASQRRLMLPLNLLRAANVSEDDLFSGHAPAIASVIANIAVAAGARFTTIKGIAIGRQYLPALMPASLVPAYLRLVTREGFDPFRHTVQLSGPKRQFILLRAMLRRRL